MPTVWLCPNHHAYWHAIERRSKGEYGQIFMSLSSEETQKLFELKRLMIEILAEYHGISMEELDNL